MKKFFFSSIAMMAMMVAAIGFVSCGSDDDDNDNNNNGGGTDTKATKAEITYHAELGPDMTKFLNVEIDFLDNGQKKTAIVLREDWTMKVTVNSLPAKIGYKLRLSRNNVPLDESGKYVLGIFVDKAYVVYNSKGEAIFSQLAYSGTLSLSQFGNKEKTQLTEEKLAKLIERYNNAYASAYELNAEGELVNVDSDF